MKTRNFWYFTNRFVRDWTLFIGLIISIAIPFLLILVHHVEDELSSKLFFIAIGLSFVSLVIMISLSVFKFDYHTRENKKLYGKYRALAHRYDNNIIDKETLIDELEKLSEYEADNLLL
jgi:glucan phosphoethanolaminetransferase (alkaline phosphatase superfamily)